MKAWKLKTIVLLAISMCFFLVGTLVMNAIPKYTLADATVQTTIENDDGFYMSKGAQVRIPLEEQEGYDATGIRFTVNLQEQYPSSASRIAKKPGPVPISSTCMLPASRPGNWRVMCAFSSSRHVSRCEVRSSV